MSRAARHGRRLRLAGWVGLGRDASLLIAGQAARRRVRVHRGTARGTAGRARLHLPSDVLLAAVAFAHIFPVAVALLLARTCLSQMDVPTRQALVMTVVTPDERTKAAAATYAARYTVRPVGPLVAGAVQQLALGALLLLAGAVKGGYDLTLWRWARRERLEPRAASGQQHRHRRGRRRGRWCRMTTRSPRQPTPAGAAGLHPTTAAPRSCRRSGHGVTPRWRPCLRGHPYRWPRGDGTASHGDPFRRDPAD